MPQKLIVNCETSARRAVELTQRELLQRQLLREVDADLRAAEAAKEAQRQADIQSLDGAEPAMVGRIIKRLLEG